MTRRYGAKPGSGSSALTQSSPALSNNSTGQPKGSHNTFNSVACDAESADMVTALSDSATKPCLVSTKRSIASASAIRDNGILHNAFGGDSDDLALPRRIGHALHPHCIDLIRVRHGNAFGRTKLAQGRFTEDLPIGRERQSR